MEGLESQDFCEDKRCQVPFWFVPRRPGWVELVGQVLTQKEQKRLQWCLNRGAPYGDATWVESIARRFNLESTLRPRGRPKKLPH